MIQPPSLPPQGPAPLACDPMEQALCMEPHLDLLPEELDCPEVAPQDGQITAPATGSAAPVLTIAGAGPQRDPVRLINEARHNLTLVAPRLPGPTVTTALERAAERGVIVDLHLPTDDAATGDDRRLQELERRYPNVTVTYGGGPAGLHAPPDSQSADGKLWVDQHH